MAEKVPQHIRVPNDMCKQSNLDPTDVYVYSYLKIQDWFKETPHIFETNFWYMWQTTFAFQKYSSLFEFRRYMNRMIFEFSRIETLEGVTRTPLNQYDSVIRPLETYLRKAGVNFRENCEVTDIDFADGPGITVKTLYLKKKVESTDDSGEESDAPAGPSYVTEEVQLNKSDICIMTNACMTDSATPVSYTHLKPHHFHEQQGF